jgi:hypothetical protein
MITLKNDELAFSFPELGLSLRPFIDQYSQAKLPCLVAEDRRPAIEKLHADWCFREASREQQTQAEKRVLSAGAEEIEDVFHRVSTAAVKGYVDCGLQISFYRTLRIPDDGRTYPLPAGLGLFPLHDVDEFQQSVPPLWLERGGVLMPMYQSEALWIYFETGYPFVVKVGAGKINAVTGKAFGEGLAASPQNYLVVPAQPWLDGFAVSKGVIRQFVAMPLGAGYSAEEQLTGKAEVGGLQLQVLPMKPAACFQKVIKDRLPKSLGDLLREWTRDILRLPGHDPRLDGLYGSRLYVREGAAMGLGAGGKMQQEVYADPYEIDDWQSSQSRRCFVHLCNSMQWRQITGNNPPHPPLTASEYERYGIPWFDYYRDDLQALGGSAILEGLKSVGQLGDIKGDQPLPAEVSVQPELVVQFGNTRRPKEVRQWAPLDG